jgi:hypothetical protein
VSFLERSTLTCSSEGQLAGSTRVDTAPVGSAVARTMDAPRNPREDDRRQKGCSEDTAEDSDRTANGGPTTVPGRAKASSLRSPEGCPVWHHRVAGDGASSTSVCHAGLTVAVAADAGAREAGVVFQNVHDHLFDIRRGRRHHRVMATNIRRPSLGATFCRCFAAKATRTRVRPRSTSARAQFIDAPVAAIDVRWCSRGHLRCA